MGTAITLEESIQEVIKGRNKRKRTLEANADDGWNIVNDDDSSFKCDSMDRIDSLGVLIFSPGCKKVDIFTYLLLQESITPQLESNWIDSS